MRGNLNNLAYKENKINTMANKNVIWCDAGAFLSLPQFLDQQ